MKFWFLTLRSKKKKKNRVKLLHSAPQRRGVCMKLIIMSPKKPNSAKRKVAWIRILAVKRFAFGYIPGEGHNLQRFSQVLVRGGLIRDLPGVHYVIIRGKHDLKGILLRRQGRSKYGTKLWWVIKKKDKISAHVKHKQRISNYLRKKQQSNKLSFVKKMFVKREFKNFFNLLRLRARRIFNRKRFSNKIRH
jgi:small subunit ribosomal protein S12